MKEKMENLYNGDNNSAYKTLLELETMTTESMSYITILMNF